MYVSARCVAEAPAPSPLWTAFVRLRLGDDFRKKKKENQKKDENTCQMKWGARTDGTESSAPIVDSQDGCSSTAGCTSRGLSQERVAPRRASITTRMGSTMCRSLSGSKIRALSCESPHQRRTSGTPCQGHARPDLSAPHFCLDRVTLGKALYRICALQMSGDL